MDEITLIVTYRCKDGKRGSFVRDVAAQGILDKILQDLHIYLGFLSLQLNLMK